MIPFLKGGTGACAPQSAVIWASYHTALGTALVRGNKQLIVIVLRRVAGFTLTDAARSTYTQGIQHKLQQKQPVEVIWTFDHDASWSPSLRVFQACPTVRRPQGKTQKKDPDLERLEFFLPWERVRNYCWLAANETWTCISSEKWMDGWMDG